MLARVRTDLGYPVTACGGRAVFVHYEYRPVPAGMEDEALGNHLLETIPDDAPEPAAEPEPTPKKKRGKP